MNDNTAMAVAKTVMWAVDVGDLNLSLVLIYLPRFDSDGCEEVVNSQLLVESQRHIVANSWFAICVTFSRYFLTITIATPSAKILVFVFAGKSYLSSNVKDLAPNLVECLL